MKNPLKALLAAAALSAAGGAPALAHGSDDDSAPRSRFEVSESEALEIAAAAGMADVREVKARRGVWKIEGIDGDGVKLEIEIDGDSGEIVKSERYGMPAQGQ